jgi:hypothetical protein
MVVWLAAAALLAGCAAPERVFTPAAFDHRVATSEIELYWRCTGDAGTLRVDGVAVNRWAGEVRFLELELIGVNAQGRTVTATRGETADILLHTKQSSPFRLDLRIAGTEARHDLFYQYRYNAEGFEAALEPTPYRLAQALQRFMVRDACSPAQHRSG